MLLNKQDYQRFCLCLKFSLWKLLVHPLSVFFSIIFPIGWTIVSYFIFSYNKQMPYGGQPTPYPVTQPTLYPVILFWSAGPLFLSTISITLFVLPYNAALDRVQHRLKFYRSFGVSQRVYLFANITSLFTCYFIVFAIQILLIDFAFKIFLSAGFLFLVIFISLAFFWIASAIGFFIGTLPQHDKSIFWIVMLFSYPTLLLSGVSIPPAVFDNAQLGFHNYVWGGVTNATHYSWFKFVQFLTPIGTGIYFVQNTMIYDKTGVNLFSWDVDWLGIFWQLICATGAYLFSIKKFRWK